MYWILGIINEIIRQLFTLQWRCWFGYDGWMGWQGERLTIRGYAVKPVRVKKGYNKISNPSIFVSYQHIHMKFLELWLLGCQNDKRKIMRIQEGIIFQFSYSFFLILIFHLIPSIFLVFNLILDDNMWKWTQRNNNGIIYNTLVCYLRDQHYSFSYDFFPRILQSMIYNNNNMYTLWSGKAAREEENPAKLEEKSQH